MGERHDPLPAWHGHVLRPLPTGESWLSGGERRFPIPAQPRPRAASADGSLDDLWSFDDAAVTSSEAVAARSPASPASARRTGAFLIAVSLAAILTIVIARRTGAPANPAPLPSPPSHVISAVSRAQPTAAVVRVGDYIDFELPGGRSYSAVLEQPSSQVPVVEALTLPGQEPQLRADSAGHAVIEVMAAPVCTNPDGCPDARSFIGTVDLTVTP